MILVSSTLDYKVFMQYDGKTKFVEIFKILYLFNEAYLDEVSL